MNVFHLPDGEEVIFPIPSQVHFIHDNLALTPSNRVGLLDEGGLVGALARPQNALAYSNLKPDLISLAAYLWHGISEAHAYEDGNKRTALLTTLAFLEANGVMYDAPEYDIGRFILRLYRRDQFKVAVLDDFLRRYCHWI